jgi:hypothetical protein
MKPDNIELIRYLSNLSVLVPLLLFVLKFKVLPKENRIIGISIIVSALADLLGYIFFIGQMGTPIIFNVYCVVSFILLCVFYHEVVFKFKNRGYFYFGVAVYVLSFFIISTQQELKSYQGEMWAITGAILVYFGILYNNYQVEKPPLFDKNLYSGLIFNGAIMLYFSFNFFLFIIANYVLTELSSDTSRMTWAFHNLNNVIKNVAFAFGLYYTGRRRVNLTEEEVERIQWRHFHP